MGSSKHLGELIYNQGLYVLTGWPRYCRITGVCVCVYVRESPCVQSNACLNLHIRMRGRSVCVCVCVLMCVGVLHVCGGVCVGMCVCVCVKGVVRTFLSVGCV